jgi:hypothetical protein
VVVVAVAVGVAVAVAVAVVAVVVSFVLERIFLAFAMLYYLWV